MSCGVCDGLGCVPAAWVYQRAVNCTCGAGEGQLKLHAPDCDPLPCPFCQLVRPGAFWKEA